MRNLTARKLTLAAAVAALYAVLSYFSNIFGIAYGPIQCRFSEALCVLPFFFPSAVPGLFIGCLISNLLSPYGLPDVIFGSAATLVAAVWTSRLNHKLLAPLPPVLCNGLIVGAVIAFEGATESGAFLSLFAYHAFTIALGELLACYVLGGILLTALPKLPYFRVMIPEQRLQ